MRALPLLFLAACSGGGAGAPAPMPIPHGRPPLRQPGPHSPRLASYRIEASLDVAQKRITAREKLVWKHAGNAPVSSLPLHLYLNAFKNETSLFMRESRGGFRRAEISSILLGELALLTAAAVPLGLALGYLMAAGVIEAFQTELYRFPLVIAPRTYALAAVTTLVAAALSGAAVRRRLDRLDLVAVLKTRE